MFLPHVLQEFSSYLWVAGSSANSIESLSSPQTPLEQQLRSSKNINNYIKGEKDFSKQTGKSNSFRRYSLQVDVSDNTLVPWRILCARSLFISAIRFALTHIWRRSKSSIFVLDPLGHVDHAHLLQVLREHPNGWEEDDVSTTPCDGWLILYTLSPLIVT